MDRRLNSGLTCKFRIPFFLFFMCDKKGEERLCGKAVIPYRLVFFSCYQKGKSR